MKTSFLSRLSPRFRLGSGAVLPMRRNRAGSSARVAVALAKVLSYEIYSLSLSDPKGRAIQACRRLSLGVTAAVLSEASGPTSSSDRRPS